MTSLSDRIDAAALVPRDRSGEAGPLTVGVELGGTKTIAVIGRDRIVVDRVVVPTTTPRETLGAVAAALGTWHRIYQPAALGIASFGPINLDMRHGAYGWMLPNPKPGWSDADILAPLLDAMPVPAALHTDVTAAALAEGRWGMAKNLRDFVYITIGTGIGMGIIAGGRPVSGRMHPEAGHMYVRRDGSDGFPGVCPFHGDCLEGLASGPAIAARAGAPAETLGPDHPVWPRVADAIAEAMAALLLTLSCERIVVGGGVGIGQPHLLRMVRPLVVEKLGGYLPGIDQAAMADIIVPAALGGDAGPLGALLLGEWAVAQAG
ncbi:MAG: ROK family protein [Sphingomonas sp.]